MTIHVNIGEAKTRLSELLRAMHNGERVIIQRDGMPEAELIPAREGRQLSSDQIAARRRAAFGMFSDAFVGFDTSIANLKHDRVASDDRMGRAIGPAD